MNARSTSHPPRIIDQFFDAANLCTLLGLVVSVWGLAGALEGQLHQAAIGIMGATICDIGDGYLARMTRRRAELVARIGGVLDSLVDLVAGGLLGAACLIVLGDGSLFSITIAALAATALACRLGYFTVVGLEGRSFIGVPVVVNQLVVASALLVPPVMNDWFGEYVLGALMIATAVANVSNLRVPKPRGLGLAALAAVAAAIGVSHIIQWTVAG